MKLPHYMWKQLHENDITKSTLFVTGIPLTFDIEHVLLVMLMIAAVI